METTLDGTFFQEEDQIRVKSTGETGRVNVLAGGVVYVQMDSTNENRVFAAYIDQDSLIELVKPEETIIERNAPPFSMQQSEQWLHERTYHAQLLNGKELSTADLTREMKELVDASVPLSFQSAKSRLSEKLAIRGSNTFSVPISTWQEITVEEARASYEQGKPVLLYSEHTWEHAPEAPVTWKPTRNVRGIIYGNRVLQADATSGIDYAVCYLDAKQGTFSNVAWKTWFSSDVTRIFASQDLPITFFRPGIQFPFSTHYTIIASDGHVAEYADRTEALKGYAAAPLHEVRGDSTIQAVAPQFCYYHEVTCPNGRYHLEFFGPRMNEQGYTIKEQELALA